MLSKLRNRAGRRLREPFGKAGLTVAVIALVFAMLGGAYAASNGGGGKATASAKAKRGPRGPKGPAGPAGLQGPAGANGKDGANGSNGSSGTNGKSVTVSAISCGGLGGAEVKQEGAVSGVEVCNGEDGQDGGPGESPKAVLTFTGPASHEESLFGVGQHPCNGAGGVEYEVESTAETQIVCNGEKGEKGEKGEEGNIKATLPAGVIETGVFAASRSVEEIETEVGGTVHHEVIGDSAAIAVPISLPIPLASGIEGTQVHVKGDLDFATFCEGNASKPKPKNSGEICIYGEWFKTSFLGMESPGTVIPTSERRLSRVGAVLYFTPPTGDAQVSGSFGVKG